MKRLLYILLLALLPLAALSAYDFEVDGIFYNHLRDNRVEVAFSLTEAEFANAPDGIIADGKYVGDVVIPDSVVFSGLTYVVTAIGEHAFLSCRALTSVVIPRSVTSIGYGAFWGCTALKSITIPRSVTSIGQLAFGSCHHLSSLVVEPGNPVFDSRDACNAVIHTRSNTLVVGCMQSVIPNSVTSIGDHAFSDCEGFTSITIPSSVTSIGCSAFNGCSLTSLTIPGSVKSIGNDAFGFCIMLKSVELLDGVRRIKRYAFSVTHLSSVTLPRSLTYIGVGAFSECCRLKEVKVPRTCIIGRKAFPESCKVVRCKASSLR